MLVISNSENIKKLEMIDPANGRWAVRWNFQSLEDGKISFNQEIFYAKPSLSQIKKTIDNWFNESCKGEILAGLVWNGHNVYLNQENLNNISLICPASLSAEVFSPVTLKMGDEFSTEYYTFETKEALRDFYQAVSKHIQKCLKNCWEGKNNINLAEYK